MNDSTPVILNVDDNESARRATTRILGQAGFDVKEAGTGQDTLRLARDNPDLVLLKVHLPDIDGLEVCRRIKADPQTHCIPLLLVSARSVSAEEQADGLASGANAYLIAPVDPQLLVATVRALLRSSQDEAGLRAAVRRWETTFNSIGHGVCLLDRDGSVTLANRAMAELVGRPVEEIVGGRYDLIFSGVTAPPEGWPFERARTSLRRETAEVQAGDRWFHVTVDPSLDENGKLAGAVRTLIEVTEQKRAQEERERLMRQLENERARLQAILGQMPAGVLIVAAPSGELLLSNQQADRILRGAIPEAPDRWHHSDGSQYSSDELPLSRSLASGEVVTNEELELVRGDGSRVAVMISSAPIRDHRGFIVAGVATLFDVTDRKQLEQQLRQAQKMDALGRVSGGIAHDFNNLLTIISGYAQMLVDTLKPGDPIRRDLEPIIEAADRAAGLTRQLLTFSRRQIVQPRLLDINRQVTRMNRMLHRVLGEDIELVTSLKSESHHIKSDPGQIEQVILNLAINSRDAMPQGGKLTIETAEIELGAGALDELRKLPPGRYIVLAVSDTGTGMDAETMSHLFEPFFTTKAKGKGTGLGLPTVYGIVKQNKGEIVVDSKPGAGTTVRIYFPVAEDDGKPRVEAAPRRPATRRGTETILLVEDEEEVRRLTRQMLVRQGYTVIEAGSGPEAVRIWRDRKDSIDMLLTDIVMPRMSGRELADKLKESRPELRVLFMSGYTDDVVARHGVKGSASSFIGKPFTSEALSRKVRSVLDEKTTRAR